MITWLHGLFGSPTDFAKVAKEVRSDRKQASMALPGHGGAPALEESPEPAFQEVADGLIASLDALEIAQTALIGYSMGARVAMFIACTYPERVSELVVIGGHPGLTNEDERLGRQMLDQRRARRIRSVGLEAFLEDWYKLDLFSSFRQLPDFDLIVSDRSAGDAEGIAISLERLSTGAQEPLQEQLKQSKIPTLWLAGERDTRYVALMSTMAKAQQHAHFTQIPDAGHALLSEAPEALADAINAFLAAPKGIKD